MYNFNFDSPITIKEAVNLFEASEHPKYLAGGMTLLAAMKQKLSAPTNLIDLSNIKALNEISIVKNSIISIGSMCTHNEIAKSDIIKKEVPGLSYLASNIADNAVRNRGTIGGSICNADPAADFPAAILCLEASIITNLRTIQADKFFVDLFETNLEENEIVIRIDIPIVESSNYYKFSSLASKYAIIGIFSCVKNNKLYISVTGAANKVFNLEELNNKPVDILDKFEIDSLDLSKYSINNDINASSEYRKSLIKTYVKKSLFRIINNE